MGVYGVWTSGCNVSVAVSKVEILGKHILSVLIINVSTFGFYGLWKVELRLQCLQTREPFMKSKMKQLDLLTCISCVLKGHMS